MGIKNTPNDWAQFYNNYKKYLPAVASAVANTFSGSPGMPKRKNPAGTGRGRGTKPKGRIRIPPPPTRTKKPKKKKRKTFIKNVKADVDGYTKTIKRQKVTKYQAKLIRRRFKNGFSPFKYITDYGFQNTIPQCTNTAKWFWYCSNTLDKIIEPFRKWAVDTYGVDQASSSASSNHYVTGQDQSIYFSKQVYSYELYNPANYDVNVVIYDIVCKEDTDDWSGTCEYYSNQPGTSQLTVESSKTPIGLMNMGLDGFNGYVDSSTNFKAVARPGNLTLTNLHMSPTKSYPFNIHWKVVKKKVIKLQPGAIHHHKFIFRPRAMVNRGFVMWKYKEFFDGSNDFNTTTNHNKFNLAVKNLTCGTLFKYYGQISGSQKSSATEVAGETTQDSSEVTTLSGRINIKCGSILYWDQMDNKYTYTKYEFGNSWTPSNEELLPVVNNVSIKHVQDDITIYNPTSDSDGNTED